MELEVPVHNEPFQALGYDWPMYLPNIIERGDLIALEPSPSWALA
jgi:hypothetical protein